MTTKIGEPIHFSFQDKDGKTVCRPALPVRIWPADTHGVNCVVFVDGSNDISAGQYAQAPLVVWKTSIAHRSEAQGERETWHSIEECTASE